MARPAPSVDRIASVLEYLADHPGEGYTLSELARRLDLNKATCHAMFAGLEKHGLLRRHPVEKTYTLGPAVIRLASAVTADESEALQFAHAVMSELTTETGLASLVSARVGDELVILAVRLPDGPYVPPTGRVPTIGQRSRWNPPVGGVFAAWAPSEMRRAWIERAEPALAADYDEGFLAAIRQRGYDLGVIADPRFRLLQEVAALDGPADPATMQQLVTRIFKDAASISHPVLVPGETESVAALTAPVFDTKGEVILSITLNGFDNPLRARDLKRYAKRLLEAVTAVTEALHGRLPDDWPIRVAQRSASA